MTMKMNVFFFDVSGLKRLPLAGLVFILLALSACSGRIDEAISHFAVQTPRPFGYVIGDEIEQRIEVVVRRGFELQYSSLPGKGKINRWLDLKHVKVRQTDAPQGVRYRIALRYQFFYAPLEVKMLTLPGFPVQFRQGVNQVERPVPDWHFTVAPIRELAIRKQDGKQYMRPNMPAPSIETTPQRLGLWISLAAAALAGAYLAYCHGLFRRFSRRTVFKRAQKRLARLGDDRLKMHCKVLHEALNELHGEVLFQHGLEAFYRSQPAYRALRERLEWFFDLSNRLHFAGESAIDSEAAQRIRELCRQCRAIERGQR